MENKPIIFAVWICKPGTYMMPLLYEVCIASWQVINPNYKVVVYTNNPELKFNLLSRDTTEVRLLEDYVPGILEEAEEMTKDTPDGMKFAHQSDFVRYSILATLEKAIYIDCDLLCICTIEELVQNCIDAGKYILEANEDTMRICNAFFGKLGKEADNYFIDLLLNYQKNYVKTSYTFNSIKYPMLLNLRYRDIVKILPFKGGCFYPNWEKNENGDLGLLMCKDLPNSIMGYGIHLYNTDVKWKDFRYALSKNMYDNEQDWWISKHCKNIIDRYIELMTQSKLRDISGDKILKNNLTELYGEGYVKKLEKEGSKNG